MRAAEVPPEGARGVCGGSGGGLPSQIKARKGAATMEIVRQFGFNCFFSTKSGHSHSSLKVCCLTHHYANFPAIVADKILYRLRGFDDGNVSE